MLYYIVLNYDKGWDSCAYMIIFKEEARKSYFTIILPFYGFNSALLHKFTAFLICYHKDHTYFMKSP